MEKSGEGQKEIKKLKSKKGKWNAEKGDKFPWI